MLNKQPLTSSPKKNLHIPRVTFTNEMKYKQRANILFDKLNSFKTNLQIQKHSKFSQVLSELKDIQNSIQLTSKEKQVEFQRILFTLNSIDQQINSQKTEYNRFSKILDNIIQTTNRECQNIFDKMTKERQNNQLSIEKFIDFKIQSFVLKNKGVWLQQDLLNFQCFKQQLNYLKKQIQQFYRTQQKELQKLKKQISDTLDKQKQFLIGQLKVKDHQNIMIAIEQIKDQIFKKVILMAGKRQKVEHNVLSMIENVINSYVKDTNKYK